MADFLFPNVSITPFVCFIDFAAHGWKAPVASDVMEMLPGRAQVTVEVRQLVLRTRSATPAPPQIIPDIISPADNLTYMFRDHHPTLEL